MNDSEILVIDKIISEKSLEKEAIELMMIVRPDLKEKELKIKEFTAGITNKLIGCYPSDDIKDITLVRVYGVGTEHFLDRDLEIRSLKLLHPVGCAPRLHAVFSNGLCYDYIDGEEVDVTMLQNESITSLVAKELAKLHKVSVPEGMSNSPCLFQKMWKFLSLIPNTYTVQEKNDCFLAKGLSKNKLSAEIKLLEDILPKLGSPIVLCHNDLLLKNIIYDKETEKISFIDFEYVAFNYQAFDIANHFCEYAGVEEPDYNLYPDKEYQKKWLNSYLNYFSNCENEIVTESKVELLLVQISNFAVATHLFWGLWSLAQAEYSTIDFDYFNYGLLRLQEYFLWKQEFLNLKLMD